MKDPHANQACIQQIFSSKMRYFHRDHRNQTFYMVLNKEPTTTKTATKRLTANQTSFDEFKLD